MAFPSTHQLKLKNPKICRVFFSSPFNGMEGEREALTKLYWPRIQSLCARKGIQFVPVDMRWGITSEMAENAQTVSICLQELDRSDMFVGFFGQVCLSSCPHLWSIPEHSSCLKNTASFWHRDCLILSTIIIVLY